MNAWLPQATQAQREQKSLVDQNGENLLDFDSQ